MQNYQEVQRAVTTARERLQLSAPGAQPKVGIVLGTGLGGLANSLQYAVNIDYKDLPGFPVSTVASHQGRFLAGRIAGTEVLLQQGRCHLYEGYSPADVCMGVRLMRGLGVESLIVTNAAGALDPHWEAGQLMLISDHVDMTGVSPLSGPNAEKWGPRFPDMSRPYDAAYLRAALDCAAALGLRVERGVYVGVRGPQMETPAETRFFRQIGGDAVGMSTVLEVVAARHMGMRVLGISCLTNRNLPDCMAEAPLEEVIRVANAAGEALTALIQRVIPELSTL